MDTLLAPVAPCISPDWDYHPPLDPLLGLPPAPALKRLYSAPIRRARFLHALHWGHTVTWSARYAGISYMTVYDWKKQFGEFELAWQTIVDGPAGDIWEEQLLEHSKHYPVATIVGLKMRKRFIENQVSGVPVQVQVINVIMPPQSIGKGPVIDALSPLKALGSPD